MRQPFESAVREHGATVLRVCRAVLGPGADADDAWQETFMATLRVWPELDDDTNVEAWLVRTARNKCIDAARARARRPEPTPEVPEPSAEAGPDWDIWQAVAALPERQRLAVAYHYLGGLPHTETAALIGGSPESIRRAASDGIRALRCLHEQGELL